MKEEILESFLNENVKQLSEKITNETFINSQELAVKIKVQIKILIHDFVKLQISNTEKKRMELIKEKNNSKPYLHSRINFDIQKLKDQLKKENILRHNIESNLRYDKLKEFITLREGKEYLQEFHNTQQENN